MQESPEPKRQHSELGAVDWKKDFYAHFTNETGEQNNEMITLRLCMEAEAKLGIDTGSLASQSFFLGRQ